MAFAKKSMWAYLIMVLVIGTVPSMPVQAQASTTTLTLLAPSWMGDVLNPQFFEAFEAAHHGVNVALVRDPGVPGFTTGAYGIENYLDMTRQYVSAADVVFVTSDQYNITPDATQAGLVLDLNPLVKADPTLNTEDFFPAIWQSVQWDQGVWFLPFAAGVNVLVYDKAAFDRAGLEYPHENWTMTDFEMAARALSRNRNGDPGFITLDRLDALIYSLTNEPFYDPNDLLLTPRFSTPALQTVIQSWANLEIEGAAVRFDQDYNTVPLKLESPFRFLQGMGQESDQYGISLLPGGRAGLIVRGFAASAGTTHPELAYELIKYLTQSQQLSDLYPMDSHARQSLSKQFASLPSDIQPQLMRALTNAIPFTDLRYGPYMLHALYPVVDGFEDVPTALNNAEEMALQFSRYATEQNSSSPVIVAAPPTQPQVESGEIVLQFGVNVPISPLSNADQWDRVIADFVAADPQVGYVNLVVQPGLPQTFTDVDCFFYPTNQLPSLDLTTVLNLDPLMAASSNFDQTDLLPGVIQQIQRDNMIWAYPLVVQPSVLWYNPNLLAEAGIVLPEAAWDVTQFEDALHQLENLLPEDTPVFVPPDVGNSYLLMLFAAYGSLPFDYRTDPPTVNLTDPATVDGMRQVLDMAREGTIDFQTLNMLGGGGGGGMDVAPFYADMLNMFSFRLRARADAGNTSPLQFASYPQGSRYTPAAYQLGAGYISANAQNPEACFRWFDTLAQNPRLFPGMSTRVSMLTDASLDAAYGSDLATYYRQFADTLHSANVVVFPELFGSSGSLTSAHIEQMWLNDAINHYVSQDTDLDTELADVASLITAYRGCVAQVPPFDPAAEGTRDRYNNAVLDCAFVVDPQMQTHMH